MFDGNKIMLLDGGLASTIETQGIHIDGDPLWSARLLYTQPESIYKVHKEFLASGSEILITASYQASVQGFQKYLSLNEKESLDLITKSVKLALKAKNDINTGKTIYVGGSVGPFGACQADGSEYSGLYVSNMDEEVLMKWHRPRLEALISGGVDFLAIETIPALKEAIAILKVLKDFPTMKAWVTFSCKDSMHTNYGDKFRDAVQSCLTENKSQILGIGINCTSPLFITDLLKEAAKTVPISFPKVVYPNSGEEWNSHSGWNGTAENFYELIKRNLTQWQSLGLAAIGGCCRVSPSDIRQIADYLKSFKIQ